MLRTVHLDSVSNTLTYRAQQMEILARSQCGYGRGIIAPRTYDLSKKMAWWMHGSGCMGTQALEVTMAGYNLELSNSFLSMVPEENKSPLLVLRCIAL